MHIILTILAVVFAIGGFVGFFFGVIPGLVSWVVAALCIYFAWKLRPSWQRRREDRLGGHGHVA